MLGIFLGSVAEPNERASESIARSLFFSLPFCSVEPHSFSLSSPSLSGNYPISPTHSFFLPSHSHTETTPPHFPSSSPIAPNPSHSPQFYFSLTRTHREPLTSLTRSPSSFHSISPLYLLSLAPKTNPTPPHFSFSLLSPSRPVTTPPLNPIAPLLLSFYGSNRTRLSSRTIKAPSDSNMEASGEVSPSWCTPSLPTPSISSS